MNIKIARADLLPVLTLVGSVVEKRQTLPILSNLYFNLTDGKLNLVGTDLEVEISETIAEVAGDDGVFTVSSRKMLDITRMLPENAVISIKHESDKVIVSSGRSRYTLKTLAASDFPRIEDNTWEERFKINQLSLKTLLEKTAFAMAVQDVRYYLNGVLLELTQNSLSAIATDGHRLAQSNVNIALDTTDSRQLIAPRKAIAEINRFLEGADDQEITLEISKKHLKLTKGETTLITKLIDGKFPDFQDVLETALNIMITVNRAEFIEATNRAAVLTTDRFQGVKIALEPGVMRITANNPEQEEAVEELEIDYAGEKIESGYNASYLVDAARAVSTENVELHLQGPDGLCIIKQPEDNRSIWLVMPMRF
ncbi:DNA polymerase III subunit beta [Candidatus Spongiihabitans sp.]|uniref:DNA polymerase III subunit beta n=1 Tax=Candidatus Spongiihabitans sp. TaxID=3101308 RepID=UPI003C7E40EC